MATTQARVTCLCGRNKQTLSLQAANTPIDVTPCYCNICRYSTGVLYIACIGLVSAPKATDELTTYLSSSQLSRHFCASCGSHLFIHCLEDDSWKICTGIIDEITVADADVETPGLEEIVQHEFVADTIDGGISICLSEHNGRSVPFYRQGPDKEPIKYDLGKPFDLLGLGGAKALTATEPAPFGSGMIGGASQDEKLYASCHCGGVQFYVTRPTNESRTPTSPYPDLLVPYHSSSSANPQDEKWWLRNNGTKYLAGTCACRSCRLGSGFPIQAWAFIPKLNLVNIDGNPINFNDGTLKRYESSGGVFREHCQCCGATVFWHCGERPHLIDVSVGLLRAKEGARAESWLSWWIGRVSFKEDALDKMLINALEVGLQNIAI